MQAQFSIGIDLIVSHHPVYQSSWNVGEAERRCNDVCLSTLALAAIRYVVALKHQQIQPTSDFSMQMGTSFFVVLIILLTASSHKVHRTRDWFTNRAMNFRTHRISYIQKNQNQTTSFPLNRITDEWTR